MAGKQSQICYEWSVCFGCFKRRHFAQEVLPCWKGPEWSRSYLQTNLVNDRSTSCLIYLLLLQGADETKPGWNNCPVAILGFQFELYHVVVLLSTLLRNQPCSIVLCLFWLIRSFTDPTYTGSIFVCSLLHHCIYQQTSQWMPDVWNGQRSLLWWFCEWFFSWYKWRRFTR